MGHSLKQTPLHNEHVKLHAKMVDFGGWNMPVQYTTVIDEHTTTREKAGLFDISHMGEFRITGKNAKEFLQYVITNNMDKLVDKKAMYTCMCNEDGGTVDDCFIYQFNESDFMMVTNASTIDKDLAWLNKHKNGGKFKTKDIKIIDQSAELGKLDLQGPNAENILQRLTDYDITQIKRFYFDEFLVADIKCIVSRTGYTREDGFEIYMPCKGTVKLWNALLDSGRDYGLKPIGLGARDTLRLEACYSLYGHELNEEISPFEGGIGWIVSDKKLNGDGTDFIGKAVLSKQKKEGTKRINAAIEMESRGIPRDSYMVSKGGKDIGYVSSGTFSPTFKKSIGLAFVDKEFSKVGTKLDVEIRGTFYPAIIVKKPFYIYKVNNST